MFNVTSYAINTNLSKNETLPHVRMSYPKGKKQKVSTETKCNLRTQTDRIEIITAIVGNSMEDP